MSSSIAPLSSSSSSSSSSSLLASSSSSSSSLKRARAESISSSSIPPLPLVESSLIWKQGDSISSTGSVLVKLAQNGYTREAHQIIGLSHTAALIGRDSDGGLPELWDVIGNLKYEKGITRLMAICHTRGSLSPSRARALIRDHNANPMAEDDSGRIALHFAVGAGKDRPKPSALVNIDLIRVLIEANPEGVRKQTHIHLLLPLDFACSLKEVPLEVIELLINLYPESVKSSNGRRSPLARACESGAPLHVIKILVEKNPDALEELVRLYSPLQLACENNASFDVIKVLVDAYPDAVKVWHDEDDEDENDRGSPLFLACDYGGSIDTIKLLYLTHPAAVKTEHSWSQSLPLHQACKSSGIEIVKFLYDQFPGAAKKKDSYKNLPLHEACSLHEIVIDDEVVFNKHNLEVIKFLVEVHRKGVEQKNKAGRLPLHLACLYGAAPLEIIECLVEAYPAGIQQFDNNKKYPLHLIVGRDDLWSFDVIKFILNKDTNIAKEKDNDGNYPFHHMFHRKTTLKDFNLLFNAYKDVASEKNNKGELPLHLACAAGASLKIIKLLIVEDRFVKEKDNDGKLPIHHECYAWAGRIDVVEYLLNAYPESVKVQDNQGKILLHFACESRQVPIGVLKIVLAAYPLGVRVTDNTGKTPLHFLFANWHNFTPNMSALNVLLTDSIVATIKDNESKLALHYACSCNAPFKFLKCLIKAFPASVNEKDDHGQVPFYYLLEYHLARRPPSFEIFKLFRDGVNVDDVEEEKEEVVEVKDGNDIDDDDDDDDDDDIDDIDDDKGT